METGKERGNGPYRQKSNHAAKITDTDPNVLTSIRFLYIVVSIFRLSVILPHAGSPASSHSPNMCTLS